MLTQDETKILNPNNRHVVLLRVGIDSGSGGAQGPLLKDGMFDFVCIPDSMRVCEKTYGNSYGRSGRCLLEYFPDSRKELMRDQTIHDDPEFETFTYGDPTTPKRSLRNLRRGDLLVFYCDLQEWDVAAGWNIAHRPALYLAGYFEVAMAGMAAEFSEQVLQKEFGRNFHVRFASVYEQQKNDLVLVKGGPGSRQFRRAYQISTEGKDRAGHPLKVLSPEMQKVFGTFGGHISIQRSPPRWVATEFVENAVRFVTGLE